jgi:hypothetical protein
MVYAEINKNEGIQNGQTDLCRANAKSYSLFLLLLFLLADSQQQKQGQYKNSQKRRETRKKRGSVWHHNVVAYVYLQRENFSRKAARTREFHA